MKTVKLKFMTEAGKSFCVSMDYADPELAGANAGKVKTAADLILARQPFENALASCSGAELIDRTSTEIPLEQQGA